MFRHPIHQVPGPGSPQAALSGSLGGRVAGGAPCTWVSAEESWARGQLRANPPSPCRPESGLTALSALFRRSRAPLGLTTTSLQDSLVQPPNPSLLLGRGPTTQARGLCTASQTLLTPKPRYRAPCRARARSPKARSPASPQG